MRKYIHVTKEDREYLAEHFGCSAMTVLRAINLDEERGNSDLANKIRKAALERGGIVMVESPEMETFHDHDGYMRQHFPNGALLELNKSDDTGAIIFKGNTVKTYTGVRITDIPTIQQFAASL